MNFLILIAFRLSTLAHGYFGLRGDGYVNGLAFTAWHPSHTLASGEEPPSVPSAIISRATRIPSE